MLYKFTCPGCQRIVPRKYKPKDKIKCIHNKCRITFPVPQNSFLNKSLEEQEAQLKRNQPRFLPPKAVSDINIEDFLFSDDEPEEEEEEEEDDKPILPPTRYKKRADLMQSLEDDGVDFGAMHDSGTDLEEKDDDNVSVASDDIVPREPEYYRNLNFSSEEEDNDKDEENNEEANKENRIQTRNRGKGKERISAGGFLFPTDDLDSDDDYKQDEVDELDEDEDEDKFGAPIFSDMEQDSEEEIIEKKRRGRLPAPKKSDNNKSTIIDSLQKETSTASNSSSTSSKRKKTVREVYTSGGETIRYEIGEDGVEVPIVLKQGKRKYKYAPKVGNRFNPYIIFNRMERQKIKDLNPELDNHELSREVGRIYASLPDEKKQKYIDLADKEKSEFQKEYNLVSKPALPKVPPNAFILFKSRMGESIREELAKSDEAYAYTKKMAELWKNLPKEEKYKYQEESHRLKKEFIENNPDVYKEKMERMVKKSQARRKQNMRDLYASRRRR